MHNFSYFLDFTQQTKGQLPKGCLWKKCQTTFLNYFLRNKILKNPTLILLRWVQWTPTLIFSEVGNRKTKPNRQLEKSPKMWNLHTCHCLQKFSNVSIIRVLLFCTQALMLKWRQVWSQFLQTLLENDISIYFYLPIYPSLSIYIHIYYTF